MKTVGLTIDIPDNTQVLPGSIVQVLLVYTSVTDIPAGTTIGATDTANCIVNYYAPPTLSTNKKTLSSYVLLWIYDAQDNPSVTFKVSGTSETVSLTLKIIEAKNLAEGGFIPTLSGTFLKDLKPAADTNKPDINANAHIQLSLTARDIDQNALAYFQIPLEFSSSFSNRLFVKNSDGSIGQEIFQETKRNPKCFYVNTDANGIASLYIFAKADIPVSTYAMKVNISSHIIGLVKTRQDIVLVTKEYVGPEIESANILEVINGELNPSVNSNRPEFDISVALYDDASIGDSLYFIARGADNGSESILTKGIVQETTSLGITQPFVQAPYSALVTPGAYYLYYYVFDIAGNSKKSEDFPFNLLSVIPNHPSHRGTYPKPIIMENLTGGEDIPDGGVINHYNSAYGFKARVVILDTQASAKLGDWVSVDVITNGYDSSGAPKGLTKTEPATPYQITSTDKDRGYAEVTLPATLFFDYDGNPWTGLLGAIYIQYRLNDKAIYSKYWSGGIDTVPPGN